MTQPLNYTKKAWRDFQVIQRSAPRATAIGLQYLAKKLARAQIFTLPEYGVLTDRGQVLPEMPSTMLRPPFPVVALEYAAPRALGAEVPGYTDAHTSRRIALAWDWRSDFPFPTALKPGVVVMSICYFDQLRRWFPAAPAGMHFAYDEDWFVPQEPTKYQEASLAAGRSTKAQLVARRPRTVPVPLLLDVLADLAKSHGVEGSLDVIGADLQDEANAYMDLCRIIAAEGLSYDRRPGKRDFRGSATHG